MCFRSKTGNYDSNGMVDKYIGSLSLIEMRGSWLSQFVAGHDSKHLVGEVFPSSYQHGADVPIKLSMSEII